MSIIYQVTKAKAPFRTGIFKIQNEAPIVKPEQVKPVEPEVIEETVEPEITEQEIADPAVEEIIVPEIESPKLSDCSEFSETSVKYLNLNNIITVEDLKGYLANNDNDLTPLAKIGKKNAAVILEELNKWEANQQ